MLYPFRYYGIASGYDCDGTPADQRSVPGFYTMAAAQEWRWRMTEMSDGMRYSFVTEDELHEYFPTPVWDDDEVYPVTVYSWIMYRIKRRKAGEFMPVED